MNKLNVMVGNTKKHYILLTNYPDKLSRQIRMDSFLMINLNIREKSNRKRKKCLKCEIYLNQK